MPRPLAAACEGVSHDPRLRQIVVGNLQWILASMPASRRRASRGCVLLARGSPEGVALPYSQIYGVGRRWTGNWTGIRGTVPNGFDVNPQFQLVVEPQREYDEPPAVYR